ncbi:energy-coupling factor transport system substrate-specific component [Saccharopolyspora kobensis]|uniref:Energy-coupling factor transport system substrate-specific component n=1 Tax=Saccharopolyspora kobensis TaxID=146035 RepID=A0A1H5ZGB8_9PSEU|nr:ECF transporter S component [Saccharopolyspora kobensis]SEG35104.1 energy-coupling factor transport system substrate-specific component [Saccharopolyspora kobensis]SFF17939.1 energy-coupling factor transport system substrate-specific component [Saccharopolyspora kobensis]
MARDAAFRYRTIDFVTVAMLGVAIGVAFWGWAQLYQVLSTLSAFAFPPSSGLFGGAWLLGGVIGGLVVRKPGAALLTEVVAASVEALLGNSWGLSTVISGTIQGFGVELVLAVFLWKRFGPLVAALAAAVAAAFESFYEWQVYYTDWALPYQLAHLGFFVVSGVVIAGFGGWALVRGLAATGALDAFGAGREHHERTAV